MTLSLLAHRLIGWLPADPHDEEPDALHVTRILVSKPDGFIIADVLMFNGDISEDADQASLVERGDHYTSWSDVVQFYNLDNFDPEDYRVCDCPECAA